MAGPACNSRTSRHVEEVERVHNIDGGWYHGRCREPQADEEVTTYTEPEINEYSRGMPMICDVCLEILTQEIAVRDAYRWAAPDEPYAFWRARYLRLAPSRRPRHHGRNWADILRPQG